MFDILQKTSIIFYSVRPIKFGRLMGYACVTKGIL
nr:MAG TPA: hypothetical protein [Caudoviricetes sp.]